VAWLLTGLLTAVTPWRNAPGAAIAEAAAVLYAIAGQRYRRKATALRRILTLLFGPVFAVLAFVPMAVLTAAVYALVSSAGAGPAIESVMGLTEFVLLGMVWAPP
jgi:hypothetical protein